jgi:hypothetical protein
MAEAQLLFTEAEWNAEVPKVVSAMHEYLAPFLVPVTKHLGEYGEPWGSGTYLTLGGRTFILTNEHVARARRTTPLLHQLCDQEDLHEIRGDHFEFEWPLDIAVLPVAKSVWEGSDHRAKAITADMISIAHDPAPTELLTFGGFSGDRSNFLFNTLITPGTSSTAREMPLPADDRFKSRFHFAIDYKPDLATKVVGSHNLPCPPGMNGSAVWNTGFVESRIAGVAWTPERAQITGVVWGWPSSAACIVATRSEYVRSFLLTVSERSTSRV